MLGRFAHSLDAGIDFGTMGLTIGLIHLRCLGTLYNKRFSTINVII